MSQLEELARFDWLYAPTRWDKLHAPVEGVFDEDEWNAQHVTFACGWKTETAFIPGMFSRMGSPRCARCCDKLGYPRGVGSPKNDQGCRAALGLPLKGTPEYDAQVREMHERFDALATERAAG